MFTYLMLFFHLILLQYLFHFSLPTFCLTVESHKSLFAQDQNNNGICFLQIGFHIIIYRQVADFQDCILTIITCNERGQNTHCKRGRVKIPLLPNNVGKKSVNSGQGHDNVILRMHFLALWFLALWLII